MEELAQKKGWKMGSVALAWLHDEGFSSPICGFSSVARLDEALEAKGKELSAEEVKYREESYIPKNVLGTASEEQLVALICLRMT